MGRASILTRPALLNRPWAWAPCVLRCCKTRWPAILWNWPPSETPCSSWHSCKTFPCRSLTTFWPWRIFATTPCAPGFLEHFDKAQTMTTQAKTLASFDSGRPVHCNDEEWALRTELALCYHLIDYMGWTETIFNHISARLPGPIHEYLVNPFGLNYTEVTPSNLLKVDLSGHKVEESAYDGNPAGFALHAALHEARDDIRCIIHTHTTPISAVAQKRAGFDHNSF